MFLSSSDLKGIRTTPVLMPGKPAVQGPDLTTLAGVTAYRTKVAERHSKLAQDVATLRRTAAAAGGQVPEAAQRDLLKKEEQRKKLGITMARLDQKILEFTAQAAGEQLPASAAASPKAPPGAGKRISLKLPGAAAPAPAGQGKRLSLKLPTRPADEAPTAAPMDAELYMNEPPGFETIDDDGATGRWVARLDLGARPRGVDVGAERAP